MDSLIDFWSISWMGKRWAYKGFERQCSWGKTHLNVFKIYCLTITDIIKLTHFAGLPWKRDQWSQWDFIWINKGFELNLNWSQVIDCFYLSAMTPSCKFPVLRHGVWVFAIPKCEKIMLIMIKGIDNIQGIISQCHLEWKDFKYTSIIPYITDRVEH